MYAVIGALLATAFFISVDFQTDFRRNSIVGTMVFVVFMLVSFGVAAYGRSVVFDTGADEIRFLRRFAGLQVGLETVVLSTVNSVVLQGLRFLKETERPRPGLLNNRFSNYVERRNNYFKLHLDLGESMKYLEDSTELSDLEAAASGIAEFLRVPYRRENL